MRTTVAEFRAAIHSGNYSSADQLLAQLHQEIEAASLSADPEQRQNLAAQTLDLLVWARTTVLAQRSQAQQKLTEISRHSAYISNRQNQSAAPE